MGGVGGMTDIQDPSLYINMLKKTMDFGESSAHALQNMDQWKHQRHSYATCTQTFKQTMHTTKYLRAEAEAHAHALKLENVKNTVE